MLLEPNYLGIKISKFSLIGLKSNAQSAGPPEAIMYTNSHFVASHCFCHHAHACYAQFTVILLLRFLQE